MLSTWACLYGAWYHAMGRHKYSSYLMAVDNHLGGLRRDVCTAVRLSLLLTYMLR